MKDKIIALVAVVALILGGISFNRKSQTVYVDRDTGEKTVTVGAASLPYMSNDFVSYQGGFEVMYRTANIASATSTLCTIPFPSATSTLAEAHVNLTTNDTTGGTLVIATSTIQFSTTSPYFSTNLSYQPVSFLATTTDTTGKNKWLKPNAGYVVFDVSGKTSYTFTGKCYAGFRVFR